jgi:hypothetical protein
MSGAMVKGDSRKRKSARDLAAMASDDLISYEPNGDFMRENGVLWYGMTATVIGHDPKMVAQSPIGATWTYWLAKEYGSYRGAFFD